MKAFVFFLSLTLSSSLGSLLDPDEKQIPLTARPRYPPGPIDPHKNTYTVVNASDITREWLKPAHLAQIAYCSTQSVLDWDCGPGCEYLSKPLNITAGGDGGLNPRWFVARMSPSILVVALAGTNATDDDSISVDLDYELWPPAKQYFPDSESVFLHKGFYQAFGRMVDDLEAAIEPAVKDEVKNVWVVGHSLGGALSQIVGTWLQKRWPKTEVYIRAFAPPRSGNIYWARYIDKTFGMRARYMVNSVDIVPHVPSRMQCAAGDTTCFTHSSWEYWQNPAPEGVVSEDGKDAEYWFCYGQENESCSNRLFTPWQELQLIDRLRVDHSGFVGLHLGPYVGVKISFELCKYQ